jgi:hypothetical protein
LWSASNLSNAQRIFTFPFQVSDGTLLQVFFIHGLSLEPGVNETIICHILKIGYPSFEES